MLDKPAKVHHENQACGTSISGLRKAHSVPTFLDLTSTKGSVFLDSNSVFLLGPSHRGLQIFESMNDKILGDCKLNV